VTVRPSRLPAALVMTALAASLAGCAGTAPSPTPESSSSASETTATSAAVASAAPTADAGRRIEVQVTGGQVTGDTGRVPVSVDEQVTLVVTGDVADELHVHGYDLTAELSPGRPAELTFAATIPGVFEVELHEAGTVLLSLQVG
jgi:hypothetical protein